MNDLHRVAGASSCLKRNVVFTMLRGDVRFGWSAPVIGRDFLLPRPPSLESLPRSPR